MTVAIIKLRNYFMGKRRPSPWLAAFLLTAAGGWVLLVTMAGFPGNGAELGWTSTATTPPLQVPAQAWDWTKPATHYLGIMAITAVPLTALAQWAAARIRQPSA